MSQRLSSSSATHVYGLPPSRYSTVVLALANSTPPMVNEAIGLVEAMEARGLATGSVAYNAVTKATGRGREGYLEELRLCG